MQIVVEGPSDEEAAKAIVRAAGKVPTTVRNTNGSARLDRRLPHYLAAAQREPWVVFRDTDGRCPVEVRTNLLGNLARPTPMFALRLAHSMTEAWLLADTDGFAEYFKVPVARLSREPEALPNAKKELLRLCLQSRNRRLRDEMVRPGQRIGPLYAYHLGVFAREHWDVNRAADNAPSLARAISAIRALPG